MNRRTGILCAAVAATIAGWLLTAAALSGPASSGLWAAICALAAVGSRTSAARAVWFNVAIVLVLVGTFDAWLARDAERARDGRAHEEAGYHEEFSSEGPFVLDDPIMGHRLAPNARATHRRSYHGETIFDVVYTTGPDGLRVGPAVPSEVDDCVLFFGGSFTFGDGVEDHETAAFQLAELVADRFRVHSFAAPGFGPHQMLAAIEGGFVERTVECRPRLAVYQALPEHVARAACHPEADGDLHGPRYRRHGDGRLVRDTFCDEPAQGGDALLDGWAASRRIEGRLRDRFAPADIALFGAVVERSRTLLAERYPGIAFHVIDWSNPPSPLFPTAPPYRVHAIAEVLTTPDGGRDAYHLPHDGHPTALAHGEIARYVAHHILPSSDGESRDD